jgi:hypothetical protein
MTMLDDDRLATLFAQAADAFAVPPEGAAAVVARATAPATTPADDVPAGGPAAGTDEATSEPVVGGRVRRLAVSAPRHPVRAAAACLVVILVAAGTIGAVVRTSSPSPTLTSSLPHTAPLVPGRGPATKVPSGQTSSGSAPRAIGAPPAFGAQNHGAPSSGGAGTAVTTPTTTPSLPGGAVGQPAKIQQTGTLGLAVRRGALGRTMNQLGALATAYGGFVASSQTQSGAGAGGAPYGSVTLQVPVANFDPAVKAAQALGRTSSLTTKATDVTAQYVDLQSRIAALEESRLQYLTILTKATTVGDVLAVQTQLDAIQSQIEQLQGQLQVLTSETSYSTLAVTVTEGSRPAPPPPLPESGVVRAWHDSTDGFLAGIEGAIRIAGPVLFALLCLAALVLGGRALWRRYQRHNL